MYVTRYEEMAHANLAGKAVAGQTISGEAELTVLRAGHSAMLVLVRAKKGFDNSVDHSGHVHPNHESIAYVLSGRIEMQIGSMSYALEPGSVWHHPPGVRHTSLALEDSVVLEFHTPLRHDILELVSERDTA